MSSYFRDAYLFLIRPEHVSLTYQTRLGNLDLPVVMTGSYFLFFVSSFRRN